VWKRKKASAIEKSAGEGPGEQLNWIEINLLVDADEQNSPECMATSLLKGEEPPRSIFVVVAGK
jgi:hypothetical protein